MKVRNMTSTNGNKVANQFIITDGNKFTFQSYNSEIITIDYDNHTITVGDDWDYSITTGKYKNMFLKEQGFRDIANKKDFEYYLNLGAIGNWQIIKEWEVE